MVLKNIKDMGQSYIKKRLSCTDHAQSIGTRLNLSENKAKSSRARGDEAEVAASKFLVGKGYKVIVRNFLKPSCEIDLIVRKGNNLLFVEVKSSHYSSKFPIEDRVNNRKLMKIQRCMDFWLVVNQIDININISIALIEVNASKGDLNVVNFVIIGL